MTRADIYALMIVIAVAMQTGRILSSERVTEPGLHREDPKVAGSAILVPLAAADPLSVITLAHAVQPAWRRIPDNASPRDWPRSRPMPMPTYSSNDRARWATARALVEQGTFAVGRRDHLADGKYVDRGLIFEPGYESVDKVLDPKTNQFYSSKPPLFGVIMAALYWPLYQCGFTLADHRWFVVRSIVWLINVLPFAIYLVMLSRLVERFGTSDWGRVFVMAAAAFGTFLTTFAVTINNHTVAAVTALVTIYPVLMSDTSLSPRALVLSGFFAGLTATFELPAASLTAALFAALLWAQWRGTLAFFVPAAAVPVLALFVSNYYAIGEFGLAYSKFGEGGGTWYDYPGSHWAKPPAGVIKKGIDFCKEYEPRWVYAIHLFVGHHGVFSLTPLWILSMIGLAGPWLRLAKSRRLPGEIFERAVLVFGPVSLAVIVFFGVVTSTANYGGWTSGARWFFWLTPLWLLAMLPVIDRVGRSNRGRSLALALLAVSVMSVSYPAWNPWRHPWLYNAMEAGGVVKYE